jgi:thioredoxin-like negative regulator of GroEL|uniref:Thioredoxin domain-containing protein n=1 Tax=viral metagenome TaxID=1070528 RepID=A0A6C0B2W6_9ZZZZ
MSVFVFSSPICPPCQTLKPVIQDLKEEFSSLEWIHVNIKDDPRGLTQKYGVTQVPTVVVVSKNGIERHSGTVAMGYYRILHNAMKK